MNWTPQPANLYVVLLLIRQCDLQFGVYFVIGYMS